MGRKGQEEGKTCVGLEMRGLRVGGFILPKTGGIDRRVTPWVVPEENRVRRGLEATRRCAGAEQKAIFSMGEWANV